MAAESPLPPEGHLATSFTHKQPIRSLQIIPVSLAAPPPDPYLFVSLVLIRGKS